MMNNLFDVEGIIDSDIQKSSQKMMDSLKAGSIKRQNLTNGAKPYSEKAAMFYTAFSSFLKTKNYSYILSCQGVDECNI